MGYRRVNGICKTETYHGFLYVHPHNDKSRLIFDLNDRLSGIQTAIPGNMIGYNGHNQSIRVPSKEVVPPILLSKDDHSGVQMYSITAYFKHPSLICSPLRRQAHPGKGLYIQMGYSVDRQYEKIPLDARRLPPDWMKGSCLPMMGLHYFKRLSPDLPCERLYPVFLMYNPDGQLGGFGWLFQGTPESDSPRSPVKWLKLEPNFYPALFDTSMLPSCMYNPAFRVFGIRIYLRNKETMLCSADVPGDDDDDENDNGKDADFENLDNNNNNNHHYRHNNNGIDASGIGGGGAGTNPRHHHHHRKTTNNKDTQIKPVVKIPPHLQNSKSGKNKNRLNKNNINTSDKLDYLGQAINVRGGNNSFNTHRGAKKNERGSAGNNKKDIIVDDAKYGGPGGHSACLKPLSLLSLFLITFLSFQLIYNISSSSSSFLSSSPLSLIALAMPDFSIISSSSSLPSDFFFITVKNIYLPFSPSNMSYYLSIIIAIVPFIIKTTPTMSFVVSPPHNTTTKPTTTTATTTTITNITNITNTTTASYASAWTPTPSKLRRYNLSSFLSPSSLIRHEDPRSR